MKFESHGRKVGSNILTRIQLSIKVNLKCLFVSDASIDCSLRHVFMSLGSQRLHNNLDCVLVISINPLIPDSAIWHKMQLHAQYSVNLYEICTTKRSWRDLHSEGIISYPPTIQDLIYHPCNFWNFLSLYFLDQVNI